MRNLFAATSLAMAGIAQAADITVLATPGVKEAYLALVPQFERASGNKVNTTWAGTADVMKRMKAGEVFDAVILASNSLEELIDTGKLMAGSRADVARSLVGVAVRAGAPKPDISTAEGLKNAMLAAKSICKQRYEQFGCAGMASKIKAQPLEQIATKYRSGELAQLVQ